ncbi:hypothetical protein GH714_021097 [Hevea brasiliensis]|uniref:Uncharacterized protein n=1 Tax=Hevea brasiliensis TaxID=3981 RepID=A0A6A6KQH3_HEVBR|nr:hypothetical protein GH714_021097 [Hevea brasiliensis]
MLKSLANRLHYYYKLHPLLVFIISLSLGITILVVLSLYESRYRAMNSHPKLVMSSNAYPFAKLKNLIMVAGHSVYTSSKCEKVDREDSWFLESYQRNPGQAATFVTHIQEGIEIAAKDDGALLFLVVRLEKMLVRVVKHRVIGLLLNQKDGLVVSYDFKKERFSHLHRSAIRFPDLRFFYNGTPATSTSKEAALKGEALVRAQFEEDPYGCRGTLWRKKLGRDPFHRSIPYPNGCPEIEGLFRYWSSSLPSFPSLG